MKAEIAVATVSGKAYYKLVNELKQRNMLFLSLIPGEPISSTIKAVITTEKEKPLINHPSVIIYDAESDPSDTVNEAVRVIRGKEIYEEVTIGVDPGKTFGVAVLCDGSVLKSQDGLSLEEAIDTVLTELKRNQARVQRVKIGSGIPSLAEKLSHRLSIAIPENAKIEIVSEAGTSIRREKSGRKKLDDAASAVKIAEKKGKIQPRR